MGFVVRGKYTPISYSEPRFEKKIKYIKEWLSKRSEETGDIYSLNKSQIFPEREFDLIEGKCTICETSEEE